MMKKIMSVLLAVIMMFSLVALPASAASYDKIEEKIETVIGGILELGKDAVINISDEFIAAIAAEAGWATDKKLSSVLSGYALVKASDVEEIATEIAEASRYELTVLEDGKSTVYVFVDIENNPELFDLAIFRAAVLKMIEKQNEFIPEGTTEENLSLLGYNRFAGELFLHMLMYRMSEPYLDAQWHIFAKDLYEMAKEAHINIDESRIPSFIFDIIGYIALIVGTFI